MDAIPIPSSLVSIIIGLFLLRVSFSFLFLLHRVVPPFLFFPSILLLELSCSIHASPPFSFIVDVVCLFMLVSRRMDVYIQTPSLCEHVFMTLHPSFFFLCRKGQGEETKTRKRRNFERGVHSQWSNRVMHDNTHPNPLVPFLFSSSLSFPTSFFNPILAIAIATCSSSVDREA